MSNNYPHYLQTAYPTDFNAKSPRLSFSNILTRVHPDQYTSQNNSQSNWDSRPDIDREIYLSLPESHVRPSFSIPIHETQPNLFNPNKKTNLNNKLPPIQPRPPQSKRSLINSHETQKKCILVMICITIIMVLVVIGGVIGVIITQKNKKDDDTGVTTFNPALTSNSPVTTNLKNCSEGFVGKNCEIECGLSNVTPNNLKIVGGSVTIAHSWPSIVYILFSYRANIEVNEVTYTISQSASCGGTLIDKTTIITAAHCISTKIHYVHPTTGSINSLQVVTNQFYTTLGSMYKVYLGLHNVNQKSAVGVEEMQVATVHMHENYDELNTLNDIAILKLQNEVILSNTIQVSCLPTGQSSTYPTPVRIAYAAGWGTLSSGGSAAIELNDVDLTIYPSTNCDHVATSSQKNWASQICSGDLLTNSKDTCQGDSGGPLYIVDTIGIQPKVVTVGITSYGVGCATWGHPAIYTRNSYYLNWIMNFMD